MNKKGSVLDYIVWMVVLLVLALSSTFTWYFLSNLNDDIQEGQLTDFSKELSQNQADRFVSLFDGIFIFAFFGLYVSILVSAYFIRVHPALFWILVFVFAAMIFLGAIIANSYHAIKDSNPQLTEFFEDFVMTKFIFDNFLRIMAVFIVFFAIVMFAKPAE